MVGASRLSKSIFFHFNQGSARIDVVFDRYIGTQSIKSQTRVRRVLRAKKPIRKVVSNGLVPLPQVWARFISLPENKADLAAFLSEYIVKRFPNVPAGCELVLGGGFVCTEKTSSSSREKVLALTRDYEEADIRVILHGLEATKRDYYHIMVFCRNTDVLLLLLHFFGGTDHLVWMIGSTARERRCYPVHAIYKNLPHDVHTNILGFKALTGSVTTSSFAGFGE